MRTLARVRTAALVAVATLLTSCTGDAPDAASASSTPSASAAASAATPTTSEAASATSRPVGRTTTPAASTTRPAPTTIPVGPASLADRACPPDFPTTARCSTLTVPADHADPAGATIELPVTVLPATGPTFAPDPIVVPAGGPGYPGAGALRWAGSPWNERRDIVLYDQRGTGGALPSLECPAVDAAFVDALQDDLPYAIERDAMTVARIACLTELAAAGVDLANYHSEASAADLAALRAALGYDEWNIMGVSYGARLALASMRAQPKGIRSVILDSVYDVTYGGLADTTAGIEAAIDRFVAGCAADADCAAKYGDLGATIERTRQRYNASPASITVDLGDGAGPQQFVITGNDLIAGLFNALYDSDLIPLLPSVIATLETGDASVLPAFVQRGVAFATDYADAMATAVNCADNAALGRGVADAAVFEDPGTLELIVAQTGLCPPDLTATPGDFNGPVESDIPALVLAGSYDPITPPAETQAVAERLANATFFLVEPGGHGVNSFDDCLIAIGLTFLDDPLAGPGGESCLAGIPPPTFS